MHKNTYRLNARGRRNLVILVILLFATVLTISLANYGRTPERKTEGKAPPITTQQSIKNENFSKNQREDPQSKDKKQDAFYKTTDSALHPAMGKPVDEAKKSSQSPVEKPENGKIGNFFDQSLFIGDSRMQGLMIYSGATGTGYTEQGLDVNTVVSKPFVWYHGSKITIPEALKLATYDRIFIKLGMNELGWRRTDVFISQYKKFVDIVKAAQPNAKIYVMAILPVTEKKNGDGSVYNNARIGEFNNLIGNMTAEKRVYYLDLTRNLADDKGFLPADAATDGIHLTSQYCKLWIGYIKKAVEND